MIVICIVTICWICFTSRILSVISMAPPHPEYYDWESVHAHRRRLGVQYNYNPIEIPAEYCRHLTETDCEKLDRYVARREVDINLLEQQQPKQTLLRNGKRQTQRVRNMDMHNPSVGRGIRVLVLLMRFKDYNEAEYGPLPPRDYYDLLFNGDGPTQANPIGSVRDYLRYNSLGQYDVTFDVRDWAVTEKTEAEYAGGTSGANQPLQDIFMKALTNLDEAGAVNWQDGYVGPIGKLNHLIVLTSGFAAEAGERTCLSTPAKDRLWSSGTAKIGDMSSYWMSKDSYYVSHWCLASAIAMPSCNRTTGKLNPIKPAGIAVVAHEYMHGFGLPDLYDLSGDLSTVGGIGKFGVMASLQGWDFSFDTPAHMSCWSREQIRWNEPILIERDGYYAVQPLQMANSCYKITHGFPDGEYLLIENKQPLKWDSGVKQGGIVIYHIDNKADRQMRRGYPGSPGWPQQHYAVALVQADTLYSIEKGVDSGEEGDFWIRGSKLGPGPQYPNTDAYQDGIVRKTGVTIEVMTNSSFIMLFHVSGLSNRGGVGVYGFLPSSPTADTSIAGDNATKQPSLRTPPSVTTDSMDSTGKALEWLIAFFGGMSLLMGFVIFFL